MGPSELLYKRSSEGKSAAAALILSPFVIPKSIWIPFKSKTSTCTLFVLRARGDQNTFQEGRKKLKKGGSGGEGVMSRTLKVVCMMLLIFSKGQS